MIVQYQLGSNQRGSNGKGTRGTWQRPGVSAGSLFLGGLAVLLALSVIGCDIEGPVRENFRYRVTVTAAGDYDDAVVTFADDGEPVDEPEPGVFIFEAVADYQADPTVIDVQVSSATLNGDEFFTVTITYSDLGMIPVVTRELAFVRRDAGDGIEPAIRTQVTVPQ